MGNDGGNTAQASLNVTAGALASITISPVSATITAGGSLPYAAQGFDQYSNTLGDVTGATTFSISPDGSCSGANCSANVAGSHTVTGNDSGKTAQASLSVTAGAPAQLAFGVQPTDTPAGQAINPAVTLRILDAEGNLRGGFTGWGAHTPREVMGELQQWLPR